MPSVGVEPPISVVKKLQTYALDRTASGMGIFVAYMYSLVAICCNFWFVFGHSWSLGNVNRNYNVTNLT
jgi:hypothetical protein